MADPSENAVTDTRRAKAAIVAVAAVLLAGTLASTPASAQSPPQVDAGSAGSTSLTGTIESAGDAQALVLAKASNQPVLVEDRTTPYEELRANPNGTYTLHVSRSPERVKTEAGWAKIDMTLTVAPDGRVRPKTSLFDISLSGGGDTPLTTLTDQGHTTNVQWHKKLPVPVLEGSTATYPDIYPGVDLVMNLATDQVQQTLVVHDRSAAVNPALTTLTLTIESDSLTFADTDNHGLDGRDATGATRLHAAAPLMWDSTDHPNVGPSPTATDPGSGTTAPIAKKTTRADKGDLANHYQVALVPDVTLLTSPETTYPVYIDPSIGLASTQFETVFNNGWATTLNTADNIKVGYCNWPGCNGSWVARSFFNLPTSNLAPRNGSTATIYAATLWLKQKWNAGGCNAQPSRIGRSGDIYPGQVWPGPENAGGPSEPSAWLGDITSNAGGGSNCPEADVGLQSGYLNTYFQEAASHPWSQLSFEIIAPDESNNWQWKHFDHSPTADITYAYPPTTPVTLSIPGAQTCSNGTTYVTTTTPTLNAFVVDNNPTPLPLTTFFWLHNSAGALVPGSPQGVGSVPSGTNAQWATTATQGLANRQTYDFQVHTNNGYLNSTTFSPKKYFTIATAGPTTPPWLFSVAYPDNSDPANTLYGRPQGSGGGIEARTSDPSTSGYSYSWDSSAVPANAPACGGPATNAASAGHVAAPATGAPASIPVPTNLNAGPHTLHVKTYNVAGNQSVNTVDYKVILAPPAPPGTTQDLQFEAQTPTLSGTPTPPPPTSEFNFFWSGGHAMRLAFTAPNQSSTFTFTLAQTGTYDLALRFNKDTTFGTYNIALDGNVQVYNSDFYSATRTDHALSFGQAYPLAAGTHTITFTSTNAGAAHGYAALLDHLRITKLS